jgi:antitoxin CptB
MRELDVLLARYLEDVYPHASPAQRGAFEALLELQDPTILAYVVGRESPSDPSLADVIKQLTAAPS